MCIHEANFLFPWSYRNSFLKEKVCVCGGGGVVLCSPGYPRLCRPDYPQTQRYLWVPSAGIKGVRLRVLEILYTYNLCFEVTQSKQTKTLLEAPMLQNGCCNCTEIH